MDFNAKIGKNIDPPEKYIGQYELGTRNERGSLLANFLKKEKLYLMNAFFLEKKKTNVNGCGEV